MYHLVGETIVRHKDGAFLLMQRAPEKISGGTWQLTAGGSALKGETAVECAVRELREETGIDVPMERCQRIVRLVIPGHQTIYVVYFCTVDCDKNEVKLQPGETSDFKWMKKEEILAMPAEKMNSSRGRTILRIL